MSFTEDELNELPELPVTIPRARGHAVIRLDKDGDRHVQHADPVVWVHADILKQIITGTLPGLRGNQIMFAPGNYPPVDPVERYAKGYELVFDTAGLVRYRPDGVEKNGDWIRLIRVDGPEDREGENFDEGGRGQLPTEVQA